MSIDEPINPVDVVAGTTVDGVELTPGDPVYLRLPEEGEEVPEDQYLWSSPFVPTEAPEGPSGGIYTVSGGDQ